MKREVTDFLPATRALEHLAMGVLLEFDCFVARGGSLDVEH